MQTHHFLANDTGAVTVDWVVLTAALVGLGLATMAVVSQGVEDVSNDTASTLRGSIISTSFGSGGVVTAASFLNACAGEEYYDQVTDEDHPVDEAYLQMRLDEYGAKSDSDLLADFAYGLEEVDYGSTACNDILDKDMAGSILAQRGYARPWVDAGARNTSSYDQPSTTINQIIADFGIQDDPNDGMPAYEKVEDLFLNIDNDHILVIQANMEDGVYTGAQAAVAQAVLDQHLADYEAGQWP